MIKKLIFFACIFICSSSIGSGLPEEDPNIVVELMLKECAAVRQLYAQKINAVTDSILFIKKQLINETTDSKKIDLLIKKDLLNDRIKEITENSDNDISKIRYLKGLEIVKILYDKVLSLDHHFAAVRTFSEINKISNPNNYPEFEKVKDILKNKGEKKSFNLTGLLGNNIYASCIQMVAGLISGNGGMSKEEKEKEIAGVECILDFTLRMHNDLNLIYFETSYLQANNEEIKKDVETMFRDYTKPIGYAASLTDCRANDDWDNLKDKLDKYIQSFITSGDKAEQRKMQVNLEFSIDRLLQFIGKYNNFIDDGTKFYQKFKTILNSYENEKQCESKLPIEYKKMKADIDIAIDKFNIAYKPVEINGTKMKELLYGSN